MKTLTKLGIMTVCLLGTSACLSSKSGDGDPATPAATPASRVPDVMGTTGNANLDAFPAQSGAATCSFMERCFPGLTLFVGGDSCSEEIALSFIESDLPAIQAAIDAGRIKFNSGDITECLSKFSSLPCDQLENVDSLLSGACQNILEPLVELGEECQTSNECKGNAYCDLSKACPKGVCVAQSAAGGECMSDDQCQTPLFCGKGECRSFAQIGDACDPSNDDEVRCVFGAICDEVSQTCSSPANAFSGKVGDACNPTAGKLCQDGAFCSLMSLKCETVVQVGQPCAPGLLNPCAANAYCDGLNPMDPTAQGTCVQFPQEGEACLQPKEGEFLLFQCALGLACINNTCGPRSRLNGACEKGDQCYSGNCVDQKCATPDPCAVDSP